MAQVALLSLTASLNPTLLAATTVMLLLPSPTKLMLGYLLGALTISITLGLVIVFSVHGSSATKTTQHLLSPAADIALGVIAMVVAYILHTGRQERLAQRRRARRAAKREHKGPPRWQRELRKGSPRTTFVIGVILTLPGASYIAGLAQIHRQSLSPAATVLVVVAFNLIMLWLLEIPLLSFTVAPDWTPGAIERARAWVARHERQFAVRGAAGIGVLLVIKGIAGLA
jgi:hypothetical protein